MLSLLLEILTCEKKNLAGGIATRRRAMTTGTVTGIVTGTRTRTGTSSQKVSTYQLCRINYARALTCAIFLFCQGQGQGKGKRQRQGKAGK